MGGTCVSKRRLMKRWILDYEDVSLQEKNCYVRVRDEGDRITTTFKSVDALTVDGTKELETEVKDAQALISIYEKLNLKVHSYQETYRESWKLDGIEIEFDEWPWIEPFFEIEAHSEEEVRSLVDRLGYNWNDVMPGDVIQCYQKIFNIEDQIIARAPEIKFGPVPDWLEKTGR